MSIPASPFLSPGTCHFASYLCDLVQIDGGHPSRTEGEALKCPLTLILSHDGERGWAFPSPLTGEGQGEGEHDVFYLSLVEGIISPGEQSTPAKW